MQKSFSFKYKILEEINMQIRTFKNKELGEIRTTIIDNIPYFVGRDVATALGYTNPLKAIRDHIDLEDRTVNKSFTVNGTQIILINESGLYSLILSSKLPSAKKFKRWVTSEVLPSIRKTGFYDSTDDFQAQEEYYDKFYMGQPVMTLQDFEKFANLNHRAVRYQLKTNKFSEDFDYFLLDGLRLQKFKDENNYTKFAQHLLVLTVKGVEKLCKIYNLNFKRKVDTPKEIKPLTIQAVDTPDNQSFQNSVNKINRKMYAIQELLFMAGRYCKPEEFKNYTTVAERIACEMSVEITNIKAMKPEVKEIKC